MFARNSKVALTFLCLVVALGLATVSEANSLVHSPRDHAILNRMIKKRIPDVSLSNIVPVLGAEGTSASVSTDKTSATVSNTLTTPSDTLTLPGLSLTTGSASATLTSGTASVTSTTSSSVISSDTSSSSSSSSSSASTTSSSASTSSTVSTSSTTSSSSTTEAPTSAPPTPTDTQTSSTHTSTILVTASDTSQPTATSGASTSSASSDNSKITHTTLTVIIVIAASIGFVALAWTLFRKWKLRPSSNFDDRMQPIDWQPAGPDDSGLPSHRRANSAASHGSFHSSGHGHGALDALPEHDFTAGPSTLAPVGGYADLQRGPSPQPSMAQLHRGPSGTRADYSAYDYNNGMRY